MAPRQTCSHGNILEISGHGFVVPMSLSHINTIQWVCIGGCQIFLASCCKFDNENQTRRTWVSWKLKNPSQQECCLAYSGPLSWLSPLLQSPFSWEHPGSHSLPLLLALASGREWEEENTKYVSHPQGLTNKRMDKYLNCGILIQ